MVPKCPGSETLTGIQIDIIISKIKEGKNAQEALQWNPRY
jgi:hypothetical protein